MRVAAAIKARARVGPASGAILVSADSDTRPQTAATNTTKNGKFKMSPRSATLHTVGPNTDISL